MQQNSRQLRYEGRHPKANRSSTPPSLQACPQPDGWIAFEALVLALLAIDLGVFNRKAHAVLIARFHWIIYLFGAFLVFAGVKMAYGGDGTWNRRGRRDLDRCRAEGARHREKVHQ